MKRYAYHNPRGNPCDCGIANHHHRVKHQPVGDPCAICGLAPERHYRKTLTYAEKHFYAGIDGEGQGREDHKYVLLAWSDERGKRQNFVQAEPGKALTTVQCLDLILSTPEGARLFGYALNYDLTKMLSDVDDDILYYLFRPELRQRKPGYEMYGPRPVYWQGYKLNLQGSKFTVGKLKRQRVVWDTFKFYQQKFTGALEDWLKSEPDYKSTIVPAIEHMKRMKERRADFDKESPDDVRRYCFIECRYMALLTRKLDEAHAKAGLKLRGYHGAGSTASAVLRKLGIDKVGRTGPDEIQIPIASAFFGGRFENSVIGNIPGPIYGYDISSAYPYQITFLPCLDCGRWERVADRRRLKGARTALVRYELGTPPPNLSWGPFPFRLESGAIAFPSVSGGGWLWLDEYLAGERSFPHVRFKEAWTYRVDCQHRPFERIPAYYLERLRIGKEGPGIVIKLGCNACYGKLAQSLGSNPPFQSWIWAGMTTAGTRAQLLDLMALHRRQANILMVATDGLYSRELIDPPKPRNTDTDNEYHKPLGGWERKIVEKGMFAARPGIYFPLNPTTDEIKEVRARGVGRATMLENWQLAIRAYEMGDDKVSIANVSRFHGAKSTISRRRDPDDKTKWLYQRGSMLDDDGEPLLGATGSERCRYGQWTTRPIEMSFNPLPKREYERADRTLAMRVFPKTLTSLPYRKGLKSLEAVLLKQFADELLEQPDGDDYSDYETE